MKVTAVVVQIDYYEKNRRKVFILDDGSGACIECPALNAPKPVFANERARHLAQLDQIGANHRREEEDMKEKDKWKIAKDKKNGGPSRTNPIVPWNEIDIGTVVRVKGKIGRWNDEPQVEAVIIEVVGLDAEVQAWNTARQFKADVLDKPWVLTKRQEERCWRVYQKKVKRAKNNGGVETRRTNDKHSTESGSNNVLPIRRRNNRPSMDQPERNMMKRKDLERVKKMDGVVKKRKDTDTQQAAQRRKAESIALAISQGTGKYDALGI